MTGPSAIELLDEASRVPEAARAAFLDSRCEGDAALRREVESLLRHLEVAGTFLARGVLATPIPEPEGLGEETLPPGSRVAGYELEGVLGEGGMGVVYRARQDSPRRSVALKIIRPALSGPAMLRRFQREAQLLGRLQHPGIAHIFEAGCAPVVLPGGEPAGRARPFFAMELVRGLPLTQFASVHALGTRARLRLVALVCDAVHHAHERGLVHRDLKPANILVEESADREGAGGQSGRPKVLDFGIAQATEADATTLMRTSTGQLIGTLAYMSPEQAAGRGSAVDARSDVYALGVVLYELLTGRTPHDLRHKLVHEAARAIHEEEPLPLSAIDRVFRGEVATIAAKALEKDPGRRYQSAAALGDDLRRYLRDEPIVARPASAVYQFRKFARRHRALVGGAAGIAAALAVGTVGMSLLLVRALNAEHAADENARSSRAAARRAVAYGAFFDRMLAAAEPDVSPGQEIGVLRTLLDRAVHDAQSMLDSEPEVRADVLQTLGKTYQSLGLFAEAEPLLLRSLADRRLALGDRDPSVAAGLLALASLKTYRGETEAAEPLVREAREIRARHFGEESIPVVECDEARARFLIETRDPRRLEEAGRLARRTLAVRRALPEPSQNDISACLFTLGLVLRDEGDVGGALGALTECLDYLQRVDTRGSSRVAALMLTIGNIARENGDLGRAEGMLRAGIAMRRGILGDRHPALTQGQIWLAQTLAAMGQFDEADATARQAISIRSERLGEGHQQVTHAMVALARVMALAGRSEAARATYSECITRLQAAPDEADTLADACRRELAALGAAK